MKNKILLFCTILFFIVVFPNAVIADVNLISHSNYIDQNGFYNIVGEVQNIGNQTVSLVEIEASFYDSGKNFITERTAQTMVSYILVNRKSPFNIQLLDEVLSENVSDYSLNIQFIETEPIEEGLEILIHNSSLIDGKYEINGNITNIKSMSAHNVKVIATYYDEIGNVVVAKSEKLDAIHNTLEPDQIRPFEIILEDEDRSELVSHYLLTAESLQYTEISEFSIISVIFSIIIITILIIKKIRHYDIL